MHVSAIVLGKEDQIRMALTCLFARGHLLIEDIPGIGKTTPVKVLSKCLGLQFRRVQFTSDMLPGDIRNRGSDNLGRKFPGHGKGFVETRYGIPAAIGPAGKRRHGNRKPDSIV